MDSNNDKCLTVDVGGNARTGIYATGNNGSTGWSPFSFTSSELLDPAAVDTIPPNGSSFPPVISCATYQYCVVTDGAGNALFYNGSAFSGTTAITITNASALIPEAQ